MGTASCKAAVLQILTFDSETMRYSSHGKFPQPFWAFSCQHLTHWPRVFQGSMTKIIMLLLDWEHLPELTWCKITGPETDCMIWTSLDVPRKGKKRELFLLETVQCQNSVRVRSLGSVVTSYPLWDDQVMTEGQASQSCSEPRFHSF